MTKSILVVLAALVSVPVSALPAKPDDLFETLSKAREIRVRRLVTRDVPGEWVSDSIAQWNRRPASGEKGLDPKQRRALAAALADSFLRDPEPKGQTGWIGPEDCDFLLKVNGPGKPKDILLSFPEAEARWLGADSTVAVGRFGEHAAKVIEVLSALFPQDSTIQDLSAEVAWFLHNPKMTGEGDGIAPYYEGAPRVLAKAPCEQPETPKGRDIFGTSVMVEALIDRHGLVRRARVKSGALMFHESALDCVKRWQFQPAEYEGRPFACRVIVSVPYEFYR